MKKDTFILWSSTGIITWSSALCVYFLKTGLGRLKTGLKTLRRKGRAMADYQGFQPLLGSLEGRKSVPKLKELLRRQRKDSDVGFIISIRLTL